jgi:TolB-like protein
MSLTKLPVLAAAGVWLSALFGSGAWGAPAGSGPLPPGPPLAASATPAQPRARVAIREFQVEGGETSAALVLQLQDGFVLGLSRAGIAVLDSLDVSRRLQARPELEKCDTALCLKRLGEVLEVRYLIRVRVNVTGNSYRMTARLFSTEASSPAALPVDTQSRFCDVCTAAEAREVIIRLAEALRKPLEETALVTAPPPAAPPAAVRLPMLAMSAGLLVLAAGAGVYLSADHTSKGVPALGGLLMGAGLTVTGYSLYLIVADARRERTAATGLGLALRF